MARWVLYTRLKWGEKNDMFSKAFEAPNQSGKRIAIMVFSHDEQIHLMCGCAPTGGEGPCAYCGSWSSFQHTKSPWHVTPHAQCGS